MRRAIEASPSSLGQRLNGHQISGGLSGYRAGTILFFVFDGFFHILVERLQVQDSALVLLIPFIPAFPRNF